MSYDKKRWKKASETTDKDILKKKDVYFRYGIVEEKQAVKNVFISSFGIFYLKENLKGEKLCIKHLQWI